jgi:4-hydroxybenzoate polyprenyltransferase
MPSKSSIHALIHLSRYKDYLFFVITLTLFALFFSRAPLTRATFYTVVLVLLANLLATCFTFMINDIEDAPDDALNPEKAQRNPVSAGRISRTKASIATAIVGIISAVLYLQIGLLPFLFGSCIVILGVFYSWRRVRLKNIFLVDIISHCLMLGGLIYLSAFTAFKPDTTLSLELIVPFLVFTSISAHGELYNELRDYTYDKLAGLKHTAVIFGKQRTTVLMYLFLVIALVNLGIMLISGLFPLVFLISFFTFLAIFSLPLILSTDTVIQMLSGTKFQDAVVTSALLSVTFWLIFQLLPA